MRDVFPLAWLLLAATLLMLAPPAGRAPTGGAPVAVVFPTHGLRAT